MIPDFRGMGLDGTRGKERGNMEWKPWISPCTIQLVTFHHVFFPEVKTDFSIMEEWRK